MIHLKNLKIVYIFLHILLLTVLSLSLFLTNKPSNSIVAQSCRSGCYWNGGIGRCTGPNGCTNTGVSGCGGCQACFDGYCCDRGSCGSCTPGNCSTGYVEGGSGGNGCSGSHKSCNRTYCTGGNCGTTTRYCWLIKYTLTYSAGEGGTLGGSTSQSICRDSNGSAVTAVPDTGYTFVNWSDDSTANPRTDTSVTADVTVTANFLADNSAPITPTNLLTEGLTNPIGVTDTTPELSATFNDPDSSDTGNYYQIEINTQEDFDGDLMWDSGKVETDPIVNGERSSDISYGDSEDIPTGRIANLSTSGFIQQDFSIDNSGFNDVVYKISLQSTGKIVIGGHFSSYDGTTANRIARLNTDGSLDTSFNSGTGASSDIYDIAVQSDDKIIIGGNFTTYNGTSRIDIARLNSDGSLDTDFNPGTGSNINIRAVTVQSDGKVLVGGSFTTFGGTEINRIARLNTDGSLDTGFDVGTGVNNTVRSIVVQNDGKIIIGGQFTTYNGVTANRIARLNTDGSLDTSFDTGTGAGGDVFSVATQNDGKIIIGGQFFSYNGTERPTIARLNTDGSLDTGFNTGTGTNGPINSMAIQDNGKIVIAGSFSTFNDITTNRITRLNSDGSLDTSFSVGNGPNTAINSIAIQDNGNILASGSFTTFAYPSIPLTLNGQTYYWRIRFWDNSDTEGPWSDVNNFTMNTPPTTPTSLEAEEQSNPTGVTDTTPEFSAIFNDPNTEDTAVYYEIEVNTTSSFDGISLWQSGQQPMTETAIGDRSADLSYAGIPLTLDGGTYYWRIRFTDNYGTIGEWSDVSQFTMNTAPNAPTDPLVEGDSNTVAVTDITPEFSAIFNDPNTGDTAAYYEIEVDTASSFDGTSMWQSGQQPMTSIDIGERSSNISYAGETLSLNGITYYWRIRFTDNHGTIGAWSSVSTFKMLETPTLQNITQYTNESVKINVIHDETSPTLRYVIEESTTSKYYNSSTQLLQDTPYYSTYAQLGESEGFNIYGLTPDTQYIFRVKTVNEDSIETAYSPAVSVVTLASQPAIVSITAVDSTSVKVLVNNNGNKSSTLIRVIETGSSKSIDTTTKQLTITPTWKPYTDFGSSSGMILSGLQPNTQYNFCVYAKNTQDIQTTCSQIVGAYTYTTEAGVSARTISSSSVEVSIDKKSNTANTRYQLIETSSNSNIDSSGNLTGITTYIDDSRASSNFTLSNLQPNTQFSFRVRSINGDNLAFSWSEIVSVVTWANTPKDLLFDPLTGSSGRIKFDRNSNPIPTRFAIQEKTSGKYLDYTTMQLVDTPTWGTYTQWGSSTGLTIRSLQAGTTYTFMAKAINSANIETSYVESNTGNTYSIILNKPTSIQIALVDNNSIDVSNIEGAQTGIQRIRVTEGQYLLADIPISFETNRDWSDAVVISAPQEGKTVVKLSSTHGLANSFTMYVVKKDTDNSFRICPQATTLEEVTSGCPQEVLYTGNFPQKKSIEDNDVTVSIASISGITYWIADGLKGTGAQGEYIEETLPPTTGGDVIKNIANAVSNAIKNVVAETMGVLDKTPLANIPEDQLTTVSATTTAVTVSVGIFSIFGNISQFGYAMSQVFFNIFSSLGFRRKRYPCGYVYDSITRNPIAQAVVRIFDINKKLIDTGVTDGYGLFRTNLVSGEYILEVRKRNYTFPSRLILGKEDYPLSNVYHGERIQLRENEINVVIPLDPVEEISSNKAFTVLRSIFSSFLPIVNIVLFVGGVLVATYVYTKDNSIQNIIILSLYIPTLYLLIRSLVGMRERMGKVKYEDGSIASNITLLLRDTDFNKVVSKRVTDSKGRYFFEISEKGNYAIELIEKGTRIVSGKTEIKSKGRMLVDENIKIAK